jgi:hypothetical protein
MGIILVGMICFRGLWSIAATSDPLYAAFIEDPNWLLEQLPLSPEAFRIVLGLLDPNPETRYTIHRLRKEVKALDVFYMDKTLPIDASNCAHFMTATSLTRVVSRTQSLRTPALSAHTSSSSQLDSPGPSTPETHAVHPDIEVPDMESLDAARSAPAKKNRSNIIRRLVSLVY